MRIVDFSRPKVANAIARCELRLADKLMALALGLDEAMELATSASIPFNAAQLKDEGKLKKENEALRAALVYAKVNNRTPSFDFDRWYEMTDKALALGELSPGSLESEIVLRRSVEHTLIEAKRMLSGSERRCEALRAERDAARIELKAATDALDLVRAERDKAVRAVRTGTEVLAQRNEAQAETLAAKNAVKEHEIRLDAAKVEMNTLANSATEAQRRLRVVTEERDTLSERCTALQASYERTHADCGAEAEKTKETIEVEQPGPTVDQRFWGLGYVPIAERARKLGWNGGGSLWGLCEWAGVDSVNCAGPGLAAGIKRALDEVNRFVTGLEETKTSEKVNAERIDGLLMKLGELPQRPYPVDPLVMYIVVNKDLGMSVGKTAAQVGHAVQHLCLGDPARLAEWAGGDYRKVILGARAGEWARLLRELVPPIVVRDDGHTEVQAGSETVAAFWPMRKSARPALLRRLQAL